jgi:hypothetical protein
MHSWDSISNGANLSPHTRQDALVICSNANSLIVFSLSLVGSFSLAYGSDKF